MQRWRDHSLKSLVRRRRMEKTPHLANLIELCHLKNAELAKHLQKYKTSVLLRGRQHQRRRRPQNCISRKKRAPTSLMAAAKFLDDHWMNWLMWPKKSVTLFSACIQVKVTDDPRLWWIRIHQWQRPNNLEEIDDPVVPAGRNFFNVTRWQDFFGKGSDKKYWSTLDGEKYLLRNVFAYNMHRLFLCLRGRLKKR